MELSIKDEVYKLKQAGTNDLEKVLLLLVNAAEWLTTKGTKQWDYYIDNLEGNTKEVIDSIKSGSTYILEQNDDIVASITLESIPNDWDRAIWGKDAEEANVFYLHRLVVHRSYGGKGIGTRLLKWAEDFAKQSGKSFIRFDCIASNKGLNKYYQGRYELKDIANIHGKHCKYEVILL